MPKPSKPTGVQLYRRFMRGESFWDIRCDSWPHVGVQDAEDMVRAYLRRRDKRRKSKTEGKL